MPEDNDGDVFSSISNVGDHIDLHIGSQLHAHFFLVTLAFPEQLALVGLVLCVGADVVQQRMLVGHLLLSPAVLYEATLVVDELVAVQVVGGVDGVNVRHPDAAERVQVVVSLEALNHILLYLDVIHSVF